MYYYNSLIKSTKAKFNSEHPKYSEYLDFWSKCRDCYKGEEAVKDKNQRYLPFLSMQESSEYYK